MNNELWYELLDQLIAREGLSRPQVAQRAGVHTKTITSWLRGDVKKPRHWQPLAQVLVALHASMAEANRVFQRAGFQSIRHLLTRLSDDERKLLAPWLRPNAPFMAPDRQTKTLVGREVELEQANLALGQHRRCVLVGMGGVGKTTLAIELAHALPDNFPDGIFWGDMRLSSAEAILESWAQACGVSTERLTDFNSKAAFMRAVFSRKQALIILDDVIDSQQAKQMVPAQNQDCAVLATTRLADVAREITRHRSGLNIPILPMNRRQSLALLEDVLGEEALAKEAEAAEQVAAMLGDLPLALHICATLCADASLTLRQMAALLAELRTRLEHLQLEQKHLVRLAFEQSWAMLDGKLRSGLAALAVFAGRPFSLETFAACLDLPEPTASLLLAHLCRRSLLSVNRFGDASNTGNQQYRQHPLLAAFAAEKLAETDPAWERFSRHFCRLVGRPDWWLENPQDVWGHVMAGMQQAHRLQAWPTVLEYSANLTAVWRRQGLYRLARQGYRWSLDAAQAVMDSGKEAEIQLNWGRACLEQSDYQPAQAHFEAARRLFTELEDTAGLAAVYYHLSHLLMEQDNHQAAEETIQQAWQGYQLTDDVGGMGRALYRLGNIVYHRGDYARCVRLTADAIRIQAETEDHLGLLRSHMLATSAQVQLKNIHAAEAHCQIAASLVAPLNDLAETAIYYYTYADVLRKKQAFPAALEYGQKALTLFRDMGDSNNEVNVLLLLAGNEVNWNDAEPERQEVQEGFAYCQAALDLCETIGYRVGKAFLLLMKGRLLVQAGNKEEACITYVQALTLSGELNHQWLQQRLVELIHENCSVPSLQ